MCGIAGRIQFNNTEVTRDELKKMADALKHRGPNSEGYMIDQPVGLAFRRLAIIDTSPKGNQPMSDVQKKIWVICNGEIYNYKELKKKLEKEGVVFQSESDIEVIIYLYKKHGIDCLKHLRGMFALALWDSEKKELILARDRVGKKPLKYFYDKNVFIFASELKALLTQKEVSKTPDMDAIKNYLSFQYVPAPHTGFKNIYKLPPAHYARIKTDGSINIQSYWNLDFRNKIHQSEEKWVTQLTDTLRESVRIRMRSDVPLGAFLSGGIDSSLIVALMAEQSTQPINTFSVGFDHEKYNELPEARLVAKRYATHHTEIKITPHIEELIPTLAHMYEEPYGDSSAIPSYYLAQATSKHVTVALNGDGGDENFAGYERYRFYLLAKKYPHLMRLIGPTLIKIGIHPQWRQEKALNMIRHLGTSEAQEYHALISYINDYQNTAIEALEEKFKNVKATDTLDRVLGVDIATYLPDDLLTKIDIATMAHSMEGRSPFLDHHFMELAACMPSNLKLHGMTSKYILKKLARPYVPQVILKKPKKGFSVPLEHWLRTDLNKELRGTLLSQSFIDRNLFTKERITKMIESHEKGTCNYANHLWTLVMLEHWFRAYID